ncbi:MAG: c-type cytochrome [Opitutaceae bacterium]
MSATRSNDSRFQAASTSDEGMLSLHESIYGPQPDDKGHYRILPLCLLFVLSGFVLFGATYVNRYSGHYSPMVYNENELPPRSGPATVKISPVDMGHRLFLSGGACYSCHQPSGQGVPGIYPPLAGSEWVNGTEDRMIRIVLTGLKGPLTVEGKQFGAGVMPAFGPRQFNWSDERIADVISYVRQAWGNHGGPVTPDKVAAIRQQIGDHAEWSESELLKIK